MMTRYQNRYAGTSETSHKKHLFYDYVICKCANREVETFEVSCDIVNIGLGSILMSSKSFESLPPPPKKGKLEQSPFPSSGWSR